MKRFSIAVVLGTAAPAVAGGMVLPIQGVHSLERAGALIAGASDADALWLDPAGLAHAAGDNVKSVMFDAAYVYQPVDYTPTAQGTVQNQQPGMGLPTIAATLGVGDRLVIAGGVSAPYAGSSSYDPTGPQRYAGSGVAGSELLIVAVGAAYVMSPRLRLGATLQDHVSILDWKITASACPGAMTCDRTFDLPMELKENVYLAPSGSIAVQYDAADAITLGATLQAPTQISSTGTLTITPPGSPMFANMAVTGNAASVGYTLPPTLRAGVELHRGAARVEAAIDVELWSLHDAISIDPHGDRARHDAARSDVDPSRLHDVGRGLAGRRISRRRRQLRCRRRVRDLGGTGGQRHRTHRRCAEGARRDRRRLRRRGLAGRRRRGLREARRGRCHRSESGRAPAAARSELAADVRQRRYVSLVLRDRRPAAARRF